LVVKAGAYTSGALNSALRFRAEWSKQHRIGVLPLPQILD